jgi:tetratricopeptide (TPR) repeat protein
MLGRAYLERASRTTDVIEREELLNTAEIRLLDAQKINPLNTDHTANLARLNTRRADTGDELEKESRLVIASDFYDKAMALSPQNAIIMNEYARLNLALAKDCDRAIELYEHSAEKDPFFEVTRFELAQAYLDCSTELPDEEKKAYYQAAADSARAGLDRNGGIPNGWLLLAQSQVMLGEMEEALVSYQSALENSSQQLPPWRIDLILSERFAAVGDIARAIELAESSLGRAPENMIQQIQGYLENLQVVGEGSE